MTIGSRRFDVSPYLRREPVTLALLTGLAVVFFSAVTGLSHIYQAQQESLADRWATRGVDALNAQQYTPAVFDFRTALLHSRDNSAYELSLAEALMGLNRDDEARAYLINLWDREPDDGLVNLELARIAAKSRQTDQALRFYHNAIYATWLGDQKSQDKARRDARLELIRYLLANNAKTQAEAELIDLAATVGDNAARQTQLGQMFLEVGDNERALAAFRLSLRLNRHDQAAMAGAGEAAFQLGTYPVAQRYLEQAVAASAGDSASAQRLKLTQLVLAWDPFRQQIPDVRRDQIVMEAFAAAGKRLQACAGPANPGLPKSIQSLQQSWTTLSPQINQRDLRRNQDLVDRAMDLVFDIERQTSSSCGTPTDADRALLLVANLHEEG